MANFLAQIRLKIRIWYINFRYKKEIRQTEIEMEQELLEFTEKEFQRLLENSVERMKKR